MAGIKHRTASCTRAVVEAACRTAGLDPEKSGWTAPVRARPARTSKNGSSGTCD
ncbi:hypothetical protein ACIG5D_16990 [Microbispora rosea]|uniref:hypothetical protein n=1 Tax=Microbispora rosea TaxID=58117 RepID=UPI0037CA0D8C